jgi:hypothetical protein
MLALCGGLLAQDVVHVSATRGDDAAPGTIAAPFRTIERALQSPATEIRVAEGTYSLDAGITLAPGRRLVGGVSNADFAADGRAETRLNFPVQGGRAGMILENGAKAEYLVLSGGLRSVDLRGASEVNACVFVDGAVGAYVRATNSATGTVRRSRFLGGVVGVETIGGSTVSVLDCYFDGQASAGIAAREDSTVTVENAHINTGFLDGIVFQEQATGVVSNSWIHRMQRFGVRCLGTSPRIEGTILSLNEAGISAEQDSRVVVDHATLARNRRSGVQVLNSAPAISNSILAENLLYGVEESDAETSGGLLVRNLFSDNGAGLYLEAGDRVVTNQVDLNGTLENDGTVSGNLLGPAGFVASFFEDFNLTTDSLALDLAPVQTGYSIDVRGFHRGVDTPGFGNEGDDVVDLGAVERQAPNRRFWDFGALTDIWSVVPDFGVFGSIVVEYLPGRFRLSSRNFESFGLIQQNPPFSVQSPDTILVTRYRLATEGADTLGAPSARVRLNGLGEQAFMLLYVVPVDTQSQAPPPEGRDYYLIGDFEGAGLRNDPAPPALKFYGGLDWLEFGRDLTRTQAISALIWEEAEYIELPRAAFDARFQPFLEYSFATDAEGWQFTTINPPFDIPFARHSPQEQALEVAATSANSFGTWQSPPFDISDGELVRITWTVSSPETDPGRVTGFRMRLSSENFEYTTYLRVDPTGGPNAGIAPNAAGKDYVSYAYIPEGFAPDAVFEDFFLAFEIYGFSPAQSTRPIRLKNVRVDKAPGPIFP